jgi:hypothetical protein
MKLKHDKSRKPTLAETMRHREIVAGVAPGTYSELGAKSVPLRQKASKKEFNWLCGFCGSALTGFKGLYPLRRFFVPKGWVEINSRLYCPNCGLQALANAAGVSTK